MNVYTPGVLTVATYNVDAFNHEHTGYSCKEIASYMRNLQADILCFQEFGINDEFGIDSIYAALSNWPYHYIPSSPEGKNLLQLAVFSRYPIKEEHLIIYPDSKIAVLHVILKSMVAPSACSTIISKQRK